MITAYNADERVETGLKTLLETYLNDQIEENNAAETDGILMKLLDDDMIYPQYITADALQGRLKPFPAICFYIYDSGGEIKNISMKQQYVNLRLALFTSGPDSAKLEKRYLAAIQQVIEEHDEEITNCVFRGQVINRKYYTPVSYGFDEAIYIAEMIINITVEVRK